MKEAPVRAAPNFVNDVGLKVNVERTRHMLAGRGLREESAEALPSELVGAIHKATVRLYIMLSELRGVWQGGKTHAKTVLSSVQLPCEDGSTISDRPT